MDHRGRQRERFLAKCARRKHECLWRRVHECCAGAVRLRLRGREGPRRQPERQLASRVHTRVLEERHAEEDVEVGQLAEDREQSDGARALLAGWAVDRDPSPSAGARARGSPIAKAWAPRHRGRPIRRRGASWALRCECNSLARARALGQAVARIRSQRVGRF